MKGCETFHLYSHRLIAQKTAGEEITYSSMNGKDLGNLTSKEPTGSQYCNLTPQKANMISVHVTIMAFKMRAKDTWRVLNLVLFNFL